VINLKQKKKEQDIHASLRNSLMKKVNIPENQFLGDFENKSLFSKFDPNIAENMLISGATASLFMDAFR